MIAPASIAAAVLTKTLAKRRTRPVSQSMRADTHNSKALSAFVTNFPGLEEEVDPARRPVAEASQVGERSRPTEARAQPIDEGIEALEIGEAAHSRSVSQPNCSPRVRCAIGTTTVMPRRSSGSIRNSR